MSPRNDGSVPWPVRLLLIGSAVSAIVAAIVGFAGAAEKREPPPPLPAERAVAGPPIAAEALVFRTRPGDLAVDTVGIRRTAAHPRTLSIYRALRAYPGAPPRIPHGLSATEYRTGGCRTCHERGGYSPRFGSYVPVTPHPELADCLSCHVPDATVVGIDVARAAEGGGCRGCHAPAAQGSAVVPLDWRPLAWPALPARVPDEPPPAIPHDVALRGNCNACHMGPGAVAEIRTTHPERANCRQCHVTSREDDPFTRPGGEP